MKTFIAANEPALAAKLSLTLQKIGVECPPSQQVSLDSARELVQGAEAAPAVVFFASAQFTPADFSLMKQVAAGAGNHLKLVAVCPASSPSLVLQAIHSGAMDFVDLKSDIEVELRSFFNRLKASVGESTASGQLLAVVPCAGGAGASSLAVNLAAAIAQKHSTCCLLDLCLRGGSLATLLKLKPKYTLLSLAEKAQQLDRAMFDQSLVKHDCGIHFLASPEPFSNFRQITPQLIQQVVQFSRARFAHVVAELEDMEHNEQVRTLAQADRVIMPLRMDFVALARAKTCVELLSSNIPRNRIVLVACREGQPNELPAERFAEVLGMPVEHRIRYDPAAMNASVNLGMPLVAASPRSKATQGIVRLADAMTGAGEPKQVRHRGLASKSVAEWLGLGSFLGEAPQRTN